MARSGLLMQRLSTHDELPKEEHMSFTWQVQAATPWQAGNGI